MQILVIEDDGTVRETLEKGLSEQGFSVTSTEDGNEALEIWKRNSFDLILLDLMLPGKDGNEILKTIRRKDAELPILILTAKDAVEDRVKGLNDGADDYIIKPFSFPELLARVRAVARRKVKDKVSIYSADNLKLNANSREVERDGREVKLTPLEFDMLEFLLREKKNVVSKEMLSKEVWDVSHTILNNSIDVHMSHLRQKVDFAGQKKIIKTIRGVGFMIE